MAITVITPNSLVFAGNPIVVKAKTDKQLGELDSFLRIELNGTITAPGINSSQTYPVQLSQPVENGGTAEFNLSDSIQTMVRRAQSLIDMNQSSTQSEEYWATPTEFICLFRCREVWLSENQTVVGDTSDAYRFEAVPGALTDFERMAMADLDLDALKRVKPMTRKPDLGIVYVGETVIIPIISDVSVSGTTPKLGLFFENGDNNMMYCRFSPNMLGYTFGTAGSYEDGKLTFEPTFNGYDKESFTRTGYYRANANGVHFLRFINGFGAVENISVRAKDKLSYEVGGEVHSLVQDGGLRPTDRRYATKSQPVGSYELSSGFVPRRWAEWYVQELLTTPRAWMQVGDVWVPGLIEADDDCVIYDRTKPEMPHVDFTFRLAIDGVTGVTW